VDATTTVSKLAGSKAKLVEELSEEQMSNLGLESGQVIRADKAAN
jgi:hypothetical protein